MNPDDVPTSNFVILPALSEDNRKEVEHDNEILWKKRDLVAFRCIYQPPGRYIQTLALATTTVAIYYIKSTF